MSDTLAITPQNNPGRFQKGNKRAVGNPGPHQIDFCTQELISQLNEVDKKTSKAKKHRLVEQLIKLALGYTYKRKTITREGVEVEIEQDVQPDINAIREVFDRVEGKARQSIIHGGDENNPLRVINDDAEAFTRSIIEANAGSGTPEDPLRYEPGHEGKP